MAHKISPTIAIDLGTANTRAGIFYRNEYKIFREDNSHSDAIPSYVAFTHSGVLVGESALNQLSENPSNTVYDITRLLGRDYSDPAIQNCMKQWPFKVVPNVANKVMVSVHFKGRKLQLTPEEICSFLLKRIRKTAESDLKGRVTNAVIAIPVYFNYTQRLAVKHAASIAGFNVTKLISAPAAAAMFHGLDIIPKSNTTYNIPIINVKVPNYYSVEYKIVIFDLGAGTLDISVVTMGEGVCTVLATAGDIHLGGNDIDNLMVNHFVNIVKAKRGRDISTDKLAMSKLRVALERAKMELSQSETADVEIPLLCEDINFKTVVSVALLKQLCKETFLNCIEIMVECLEEAKITNICMINSVILLGGSSRIPRLQYLIREYFKGNNNINILFEPEKLAVTYGTSILASQLDCKRNGKRCNMELIDATTFPLGMKPVQGEGAVMVPKNTQIPTTKKICIDYSHNGQQNSVFHIYEVKGKYSAEHIPLSTLELCGRNPPSHAIFHLC